MTTKLFCMPKVYSQSRKHVETFVIKQRPTIRTSRTFNEINKNEGSVSLMH